MLGRWPAIFSDAINVINVKLYVSILLIELYLFIPLSATFTIFQGHSSVKQFELKMSCSYPIILKLKRSVKYVQMTMNRSSFWRSLIFKGGNWQNFHIWRRKRKKSVRFFSDLFKPRSLRFCMIIALQRVYSVIIIMITLTLFQGHKCLRKMNRPVLDSFPL